MALNKIAGEWDLPLLAELIDDLDKSGFDVSLTGFDAPDMDALFAEQNKGEVQEDNFDAQEEAAKIIDPTAKRGQVWQLGRHRLMCGDSTVKNDIDRLMDGKLADMVFTDPPYNVNYEGGTKNKLKIMNDKMSSDKFRDFLFAFYEAAFSVTMAGGAIYVCHADTEGYNFRGAMIDAGWLLKQCIVWVKNAMVMGRQDYHWRHEPILYGWKPGSSHNWCGNRKQTTVIDDFANIVISQNENDHTITFNSGVQTAIIKVPYYEVIYKGDDAIATVWRFEKPNRNGEHPTMKPVGIPARAINNSCKRGGIVLDSFGGSGSTLIAAEQTGRCCYTMELDPIYCDVIIKRWEQLTGQQAVLANE